MERNYYYYLFPPLLVYLLAVYPVSLQSSSMQTGLHFVISVFREAGGQLCYLPAQTFTKWNDPEGKYREIGGEMWPGYFIT